MVQKAFPMLSVDRDRGYTHKDFADFYKTLFSNGVALTIKDALLVKASPGGGMRLVVSIGSAILNGYQYHNTEEFAMQVPVASSTQDRVDSIVVRYDVGARQITIAYKQGDTSVTRNDLIWELQLATVRIGRNKVDIFNSDITDKRADESVCGFSSPYEKVSVSGLEQQYKSMLQQTFDNFKLNSGINETELRQLLTEQETIFQQWFSTLQSMLGDNQASNLQAQIDELSPEYTILTITHNLGAYPEVNALSWEYGLGTVPLEEQPIEIPWDGTAPESIPVKAIHLSRNQVQVKVPVNKAMTNPIVEAKSATEINLTEGIQSMQIRLGVM